MTYVQTPLGGRNIMTEQERAGINDQRQLRDQAMADERQQRALDAAMAQAQLQADAQRYGVDADLAARGEFGQRADLQREMAQMSPGYIQAQLAQRQYEDQRGDNAWRRDLQGTIGGHIGSQIEGQLGGPDAQPFLGEDDLRGLALAAFSPEYAQSVSQREMAQSAREDQIRSGNVMMAQQMMDSGNPEAQRQGAAIFASIMGELGMQLDADALIPRRHVDESTISQSPQMQLALQRIIESNPALFRDGNPEELRAAVDGFIAEAESMGVSPDDARAFLGLWSRENNVDLAIGPTPSERYKESVSDNPVGTKGAQFLENLVMGPEWAR